MRIIDRETSDFLIQYYKFFFIGNCNDSKTHINGLYNHISFWDYIKNPIVINELTGIRMMDELDKLYVIKNMELLVTELRPNEIPGFCQKNENEDLYFFDDSFLFTIVFTHEYVGEKNRRYCFFKELS